MNDIHETLARTNLFKDVPKPEILRILSHTHYQRKQYEKDQLIALSGEKCNQLFIILKGSVKGEMIDFSGKTIKIEDIKGPETVASAFLFGNENKFPVNISATDDVDMVFISKESLLTVFRQNKQVLLNYLNVISSRTQFLTQKMKFLSFKTIQGKMANYLLSILSENQLEIEMPKTHTELAILFGVTRPSLGRVLAEMEHSGIITVQKRKIKICNLEKLKALAI